MLVGEKFLALDLAVAQARSPNGCRCSSAMISSSAACVETSSIDVGSSQIRAVRVNREAARQLASRARSRVQGAATAPDTDLARQRQVVAAFLAASRHGEFDTLLALLDPDVVLRADSAAVRAGATSEVRGSSAVAETFAGRARAARPALVDGAAAAVWAAGGRPRVVFTFTITDGRIVAIDILADPEYLAQLDLTVPDDRPTDPGYGWTDEFCRPHRSPLMGCPSGHPRDSRKDTQ